MKYGLLNRFILIMIIIAVHIAFISMIVILANFIIDSPAYSLDYFKLTRLSKNHHFSLCPVLECRQKYRMTIFLDVFMTLFVFCQSLIFTNKNLRQILLKNTYLSTNYYAIFFPKLIAYFSISMTAMLFQPTRHMGYLEFDMSNYIPLCILYIPLTLGIFMMLTTLRFHYFLNDELGGCLLMKLMVNKDIMAPLVYLFGRDRIYHIIRSPFRSGAMIFFIFCNPRWEIGRMIYTALFCLSCYAECVNEEQYYSTNHKDYRYYMKSISNRFFIFKLKDMSPKKIKAD